MAELYLESQKTYNGRYMYLSCTQEAVPEENKSIIYWTLTVTGGESSYYTTGPTTVTVDGQTVYYADKVYYNAPQFPASKGSVSGEMEVFHDADGTKTVECSIKTAIYNGVMQENKASFVLDAIAQESTVLVGDGYIGSTCVVLVDRKSTAYTHTIGFCTPDLDGFLCADGTLSQEPVKLDATNIPFLLPLTLYDRIPNDRKIECRLVCTTYSGDTQIGESQECTFQASCREEDCVPLVSAEVTDCNAVTLALTGDEDVLVRFFSRANCQIKTQGRNGASIVKKQVGAVEMAEDTVKIDGTESGTFSFQATDSRGYRAEYTVEKTLIPYKKLTANCTARRQAPTSDRVELTVSGVWWEGNFGAIDNTLEVTCQVGENVIALEITAQEDAYTATAAIEGLAYDQTSVLSVTVKDQLMELTPLVTVKPGVPVFDWGQKDFAFHVPVTLADGSAAVSQKMLLDAIFPVHSIVVRYDNTSPAELFGGVWERIVDPETGEGVFLFSVPEGEEIGSFDGEAEVTLTEEQIPSHKHGFLDYWTTTAGTGTRCAVALNGDGAGLDEKANDRSYTANTGGGAAHNNMPPYVKVAIWRRVA